MTNTRTKPLVADLELPPTRLTDGTRCRILVFVNERIRKTPAPEYPSRPEAGVEGGSPVVRKARQGTRTRAVDAAMRPTRHEINEQEEQILRAATLHLIQKHGMFLVATGTREVQIKGFRVWIITVTLRYAVGHEGYIGDLLYDGEQFTFLTEQSVMDQRAQEIAEDPAELRKWDEYRASTLHPGDE